ncbi:MAG: helix-turn-helix domain-containing protein [Nocardioides sp.]
MNDRLRAALAHNGFTTEQLARRIQLDPKSVARWLTRPRTPHPANQRAAADALGVSPSYLWPSGRGLDFSSAASAHAEIVGTYPDRASVRSSVWLGGTLGSKVRASMTYFTGLIEATGCEVRLHDTMLYASIFRYDDEALINPHIWGAPASANPILHIRDVDDGLFAKYLSSFEAIWSRAATWNPETKW